jgi:hypothetical protein
MALISAYITSPANSNPPFPLLAAVGAKTKRIEIGTAVIDMRYENPLYMAEDAGAADVIDVGIGHPLRWGVAEVAPAVDHLACGEMAENRVSDTTLGLRLRSTRRRV